MPKPTVQPPNPQHLTPDALLEVLTNLKPGVKLNLEILPSGDVAVSNDTPQTKAGLIEEKFSHLKNQPITVSQAAEKYGIERSTILRWKYDGFIAVLDEGVGRGSRMVLNHADVAACVHVYNERKESGVGYRGVPLFNPDGTLYELKRPDIAEYRRRKKQAA